MTPEQEPAMIHALLPSRAAFAGRALSSALAAALVGALTAQAAAPADARPDQYAYGWPVVAVDVPGAFQRLALTREVRAAATSPVLADLAVFDDDDRRMPAFLIEPGLETAAAGAPVAVPVFETVERLAAAGGGTQITVQASGDAQVQAQVSIQPDGATDERRWYAMLDEQRMAATWRALRFEWESDGEQRIVALELAVSDDLQYWRPVAVGALALLASGPATLKRDRIDLEAPLGRYLRLTAREAPASWRLTGIALLPQPTTVEPQREWAEQAIGAGVAALDIDLGSALRIDRFELALQPNAGLRRVRLASADSAAGPWTPRADTLFHALDRPEGPFVSAPFAITPTPARYWRFEVIGEGVTTSIARLGWMPTELVFMAQGRAPYRVVAGRAAHDAAAHQDEMGASARALWRPADGTTFDAALGPRFALAGEKARTLSATADWKRWFLWALLALGVGAVLYMATQLMREMKSATPG